MAILGVVFGAVTALAIYALFGRLRRRAPAAVAVLGWVCAACAVLYAAGLTRAYLEMRGDPRAPLGPVWGFVALMLGILLLVCAALGRVHGRRFGMPWSQAFGLLMAQAGAAVAIGFGFNRLRYPVAALIRGGNQDVAEILTSYDRVTSLFLYFDLSLLISLLLLTALPVPLGKKRVPQSRTLPAVRKA